MKRDKEEIESRHDSENGYSTMRKKKTRLPGVLRKFSLHRAGGDHIHGAKDDLPRKVECSPEVAVKDAERTRVAPDGTDGAREGHQRAHFVTRSARGEECGDLRRGNVRKGAAGAAGARAGEHRRRNGEKGAHEPVQPVRDEEGVERGKGLRVWHDEGHNGDGEHAVRAHLRARDGDARDVSAVGG